MSSESQINQKESTQHEPTQQEPTQQESTQQENNYDSLGMWFSHGTDTPLPLRTLMHTINSEKTGKDKLTEEELEQVLSFVEMMSEKAPHMNVEITPLVYFIKHLNHTKDTVITSDTNSEQTSDDVAEETMNNENVLEELSDDSEEVTEEEEEEEEEDDEEEEEEDKDEEEETTDQEEDSQFMYSKELPHLHINNTTLEIPFPITCIASLLMVLYSVQLGLLFCRLFGCNYLYYSHDEL